MGSGSKLTNKEAIDRILAKCKEKEVNFLGFKNEKNIYENNKTHLVLQCKKCNNTWDTTNFDKFV